MLLFLGAIAAAEETVAVSGRVEMPAVFEELGVGWVNLHARSSVGGRTRIFTRDTFRIQVDLARGGRYRFRFHSIMLTGAARIRVPRDLVSIEPEWFEVPPEGPVPDLVLRVVLKRGTHAVRVRARTRSGKPVPGARVLLYADPGRKRRWTPYGFAETNVKGEVLFDRLPAGKFVLDMRSTGSFARQNVVRKKSRGARAEFVLYGGNTKTVDYHLEDAGVLQVRTDFPTDPALTVWNRDGTRVVARKQTPDLPGAAPVYRFAALPPGRYRVIATLPTGATRVREANVASGRTTIVRLGGSRPPGARFEPLFRWETMPAGLRFAQLFVTDLQGDRGTTALRLPRGGGARVEYGKPLADGPVLLRYASMRLARLTELDSNSSWQFDVTPPRARLLARGRARLQVSVTRDGKPLRDLFCGIRRLDERAPELVAWMRYVTLGEKPAVFDRVLAGRYELVLVDRVQGVDHGIGIQRRKITVGYRSQAVDWELSDDVR